MSQWYARWSWSHIGLGLFWYSESGEMELGICVGPLTFGWRRRKFGL